jgi:CarD family transcriptional regulator
MQRATATTQGEKILAVGKSVRYRGLGAGQVVRHETREVKGVDRTFAVVFMPHRDLSMQIRIDDDKLDQKVAPIEKATALRQLLTVIGERGRPLQRTWDERERAGRRRLVTGGPTAWAELLRDYATARRDGMPIAASDADIVRDAIEMLAAELACASSWEFRKATATVEAAYEKAHGGARVLTRRRRKKAADGALASA